MDSLSMLATNLTTRQVANSKSQHADEKTSHQRIDSPTTKSTH